MKSQLIFSFLLFTAIFVVFVWVLLLPPVRVLVLQHAAGSFSVAQGKVLSSQVAVDDHRSKRNIFYRPSIWYEYYVAGHKFTGRRYRYNGHPAFSAYASADEIVMAHPRNSQIEVYYNPADPSDAILSPGVRADDVGMLLATFPMCLMMLAFVVKISRQIVLSGRPAPVAGGVKIISDHMTTRVRLPRCDPLISSLLTIGVLSFVSGIVMSLDPYMTMDVAELTMSGIAFAGGIVYLWFWRKIASGTQDLVIDEAARKVQLPLTYKRRAVMQCAFSDIADVSLVKVGHRQRYGMRYTYAPTLHITGKQPQRLTDLKKERAELFAAWLREKLGVGRTME